MERGTLDHGDCNVQRVIAAKEKFRKGKDEKTIAVMQLKLVDEINGTKPVFV